MNFKIVSDFKPSGDQPEAIEQLVNGLKSGTPYQTLLGVTGSGKTFTIANVLEKIQRPTLILSHNKTLAAQLYGEFRQFFPNNAVEYFVSYYDYYQPEAYLPTTDTYIEKDLSINQEIERLRLSATSALLSGRRDVIVVSSVSCLYGIGNPEDFHANTIKIKVGQIIGRNQFLHKLTDAMYYRSDLDFKRGTFRVKGDVVDIYASHEDMGFRILFWDDEIEELQIIDPLTGHKIDSIQETSIYPANIFVTTQERIQRAIAEIQEDLTSQVDFFYSEGKSLEGARLKERVEYDLEMIRELGYCSGIENYSRYFDGRKPGTRPFCLLDYFPDDFLLVIDESHVTIPQIHAMYGGDRSRKVSLVDYGFRLPAAIDNRPLTFAEFEELTPSIIYVSATPADYELDKSEGVVVEQIVRPTGLLDPEIEVKPTKNQIDDLVAQIRERASNNERVLVTTLTKRMAEELTNYLSNINIQCQYIHSDVDTMDRVQIIEDLRSGKYDVLIGVNLLREGLDLPEVSLVAIMDADKEGFLRSARALTQTAGRAGRNIHGKVIFYADKITDSMKITMDETERRRKKQEAYNIKNCITPTQIHKSINSIMGINDKSLPTEKETEPLTLAADPKIAYMTKQELSKNIETVKKAMKKASKELEFMEAARLRDEMYALQKIMVERYGK